MTPESKKRNPNMAVLSKIVPIPPSRGGVIQTAHQFIVTRDSSPDDSLKAKSMDELIDACVDIHYFDADSLEVTTLDRPVITPISGKYPVGAEDMTYFLTNYKHRVA